MSLILTLYLECGFAHFPLGIDTDLSCILVSDSCDGEGMAAPSMSDLKFGTSCNRNVITQPSDTNIGWCDGAFKDGIFAFICSNTVQLGSEPHQTWGCGKLDRKTEMKGIYHLKQAS